MSAGPGRVPLGAPSETLALAARSGALVRAGDVVLLAGDLGAGKTVVRAAGSPRASASTEPVASPTFTIVREYEGRVPLVHVDVYRLDTLARAPRPRPRRRRRARTRSR